METRPLLSCGAARDPARRCRCALYSRRRRRERCVIRRHCVYIYIYVRGRLCYSRNDDDATSSPPARRSLRSRLSVRVFPLSFLFSFPESAPKKLDGNDARTEASGTASCERNIRETSGDVSARSPLSPSSLPLLLLLLRSRSFRRKTQRGATGYASGRSELLYTRASHVCPNTRVSAHRRRRRRRRRG